MIKSMVIEYDGSTYSGWQRQTQYRSVQGTIEKLLSKLYNCPVTIDGSGRTDAKVHSIGQVASFQCDGRFTPEKLKYVLNNLLPEDIFITSVDNRDEGFHARFSVKSKKYLYKINMNAHRSVFNRKYAYQLQKQLDIEKMIEASKYFLGEHDFTTYRAQGSSNVNPVREIYDIEFSVNQDELSICYWGNGFLYKMVRIMTGTLLDVGLGKIQPEMVAEIIISKDRSLAKKTAPAEGLYLLEVLYR